LLLLCRRWLRRWPSAVSLPEAAEDVILSCQGVGLADLHLPQDREQIIDCDLDSVMAMLLCSCPLTLVSQSLRSRRADLVEDLEETGSELCCFWSEWRGARVCLKAKGEVRRAHNISPEALNLRGGEG
jgi:hypothetical protein